MFGTQQAFAVRRSDQLLAKLRWDLGQLEQLRWDEDLGDAWRQVVSYKAMDCAMSIWHLPEWFAESVSALNPITSLCAFLDIPNHDAFTSLPFATLRNAAVKKCTDLDVCRVIANASKHSKVDIKPRPGLSTFCYQSMANRGSEAFMRPVMWIRVDEGATQRDMRDVFHACFVFWSNIDFVSRPGTTWAKGDPLPAVEIPTWSPQPGKANGAYSKRRRNILRRFFARAFR